MKAVNLGLLGSKQFWFQCFSLKKLGTDLLFFSGFFFGVLELIDFFYTNTALVQWFKSHWGVFIVVVVFIASLTSIWDAFPEQESYYRYKGSDAEIGYKISDIFKIPGDKVIPMNSDFNIELQEKGGAISINSIQGQFLKIYYKSTAQHLEADINLQLKNQKLEKPVELGTVLKVEIENERPNDRSSERFYLLVSNNLNEHGNVNGIFFEDIQSCLNKLWQFIETAGELSHIVIPVIGSGMTRIANKKRIDFAKEIVTSFSAAITQAKICDRLTIAIHPSDVKQHEIYIKELADYMKYTCMFKESAPSSLSRVGRLLES